jgi:hypothetical protein
MEKLIYLLWKKPEQSLDSWRRLMCGELGMALLDSGARSLQFNLVDEAVAAGTALRLVSSPPADGFAAFWLDSAQRRARCEQWLSSTHVRSAGYLVAESCIRDESPVPAVAGARSYGFSLVGFAQRPERLRRADWLRFWLDDYTDIALATLPIFRYVQNVVVRRFNDDAPPLDSIVEESFPPAALTSPCAFYDAENDEEKYQRRLQTVMHGCSRFIDFNRLNSLPMSEYIVQPLGGVSVRQ